MGCVRALLAPEVDFGIAIVTGGAGHRGGLLLGLLRDGVGLDCGRIVRPSVIAWWRAIVLGLEALHRRPCLHQRAIDREVIVRQQRFHLAVRQDGGQKYARHRGGQQPVAVLGEHRRHPDRVVNAEAHDPAEQQVILHLLHQLALGPHRKQDLDQVCPHQPLRRDGGATLGRIKPVEIGIKARQRVVDHLTDLSKRMARRDALLKVHIAEKRTRLLVRSPHDYPRKRCRKRELCSSNRVERRVLQQPAKGFSL